MPAARSTTPAAKPMPRYPSTTGSAAFAPCRNTLDEVFRGAVGVDRPADEVALEEVAAAALEVVALRLGLDALAHHLDVERMRQRHDRRDDGALVRVGGHLGGERAVDLELVDREALQVGQAGVAGAEVVDHHRHAEILQLVER